MSEFLTSEWLINLSPAEQISAKKQVFQFDDSAQRPSVIVNGASASELVDEKFVKTNIGNLDYIKDSMVITTKQAFEIGRKLIANFKSEKEILDFIATKMSEIWPTCPSIIILLAHAQIENGHFKALIAGNIWNLKYFPRFYKSMRNEDFTLGTRTDEILNGKRENIADAFYAPDTLEKGMIGMKEWLTQGYYRDYLNFDPVKWGLSYGKTFMTGDFNHVINQYHVIKSQFPGYK